MYVHEYQAKALLAGRGIVVPAGRLAASARQAGDAYEALHHERAVVKAQIHAGGRGKAGGVLSVGSRSEAEAAAQRLLGSTLVTGQTGPRGRPVDKVLVEEQLDVARECYVGLCLDRSRGCPLAIASGRGGVEVEALAHAEPGAVIREWGNPFTGLLPFQARKLFAGLGLPRAHLAPAVKTLLALAGTFVDCDCSLIELNPLALCADGRLVAADVKMALDDNALSRHPELADLRDTAQEDPREVEAQRFDLSYVGMEGTVGCMVNGAGLAMATMDLIRLHGGEPANFLDVGGAATAEKVAAAFRILCQDARVRAILVNIFGGIVRCDLVAEGVMEAVKRSGLRVPLVVRLEGTNAAEGRAALAASGLEIASAPSLDEAAAMAVRMAKR